MWLGNFAAQDWRRIRKVLQICYRIHIGDDTMEWVCILHKHYCLAKISKDMSFRDFVCSFTLPWLECERIFHMIEHFFTWSNNDKSTMSTFVISEPRKQVLAFHLIFVRSIDERCYIPGEVLHPFCYLLYVYTESTDCFYCAEHNYIRIYDPDFIMGTHDQIWW